jgi:hypothetical protein
MVVMTKYANVYEHGIEAIGDPPQGLLHLATRDNDLIYAGYTLAVLDRDDGSSLNQRVAYLVKVGAYTVSDFYEEHDAKYCLRATLYHLNQIIDSYATNCHLLEQMHPGSKPTKANTSGGEQIVFEVDAFLSAARRVYEAISKVLWKHYAAPRGMNGRWGSMRKAVRGLEQLNIVPAAFFQTLKQSWDGPGENLADYRNYVMHTASLAASGAPCWMNRFDGRWGATVLLPANPKAKKIPAAVSDTGGLDALGYCHDVAAHLVGLSEALMALPEISSYIANPPRHTHSAHHRRGGSTVV